MTDDLLAEIRAANAALEATQRRKGVLTRKLLAECLPARVRNDMSPYEIQDTVAAINRALAVDEPEQLRLDPKSRQANDP